MTPLPRLVLFTPGGDGLETVAATLRALSSWGEALAVVHRNPAATTRRYIDEARVLQATLADSDVRFFVHGRLDVALALGAQLHLPVNAPTPAEIRRLLGRAPLQLSVSVHDAAELERADGADWGIVAPVFGARSKSADTRTPLGPSGYRSLAARSSLPLYPLGGVTPENLPLLGWVPGAAVLGGVWQAGGEDGPRHAAEALLRSALA